MHNSILLGATSTGLNEVVDSKRKLALTNRIPGNYSEKDPLDELSREELAARLVAGSISAEDYFRKMERGNN